MAIPGFSLLMVTVHISAMNSLTMPELMISLSYASLHTPLMPSKVSFLAPSLRNTDSTLLALDVLGFSQFKQSYAQILDDHAHEGFGAMNKRTFLQAIEKPFLKSFTPENIKKSFEIVGLHCDEISVRLTVIRYSDRARYEPTMVAWYALVPLAGRRVLLGAYLRAPSREVLRHRKGG